MVRDMNLCRERIFLSFHYTHLKIIASVAKKNARFWIDPHDNEDSDVPASISTELTSLSN